MLTNGDEDQIKENQMTELLDSHVRRKTRNKNENNNGNYMSFI